MADPSTKNIPFWVLPVLTVVVPAIVSAAVSWYTVNQTALNQEHENFATAVRDMDDDFKSGDKAAIAFAGLSQLATDEASSRALIMIGTSSTDPSVRSVFLAYLSSNPDAHKYLDKNWTATFTPSPKTAAIINAAQATPAPVGWVYLGQTGTDSGGDCKGAPVSVPQTGQTVSFCGEHYIRQSYTPDSPAVGVLKAGSVAAEDVNATKISGNARTVWVKISLPAAPVATPGAPQ
jgi:hypothetical protein